MLRAALPLAERDLPAERRVAVAALRERTAERNSKIYPYEDQEDDAAREEYFAANEARQDAVDALPPETRAALLGEYPSSQVTPSAEGKDQ